MREKTSEPVEEKKTRDISKVKQFSSKKEAEKKDKYGSSYLRQIFSPTANKRTERNQYIVISLICMTKARFSR